MTVGSRIEEAGETAGDATVLKDDAGVLKLRGCSSESALIVGERIDSVPNEQ